jgi:voltage-gated potassium channel
MVFLGAMALIGSIVPTVSRDVAIFLVDAGLLFREFFRRVSRLVIPAFAFVTFYSLIVILFASTYRLISAYPSQPHFRVGDALRGLSFSEAVYFSIGTISTVGYGDIIPYSNLARALSSVEVFCGIMLLLFGVRSCSSMRESVATNGLTNTIDASQVNDAQWAHGLFGFWV